MEIEVFSDIVCPWCYVGHARLQQALDARPQRAVRVTWLPFELNPNMPLAGRDRLEYMQERFGDINRFADAQQQLVSLGSQLGIDFRFDAIQRSPNTRRAHVLLAYARHVSLKIQSQLVPVLFRAYFTDGLDIGDPAVLISLAEKVGIPALDAQQALDRAGLHEEVRSLELLAQNWNVSGVPTFIFNRQQGFSGAQPLEVFLQILDAPVASKQ